MSTWKALVHLILISQVLVMMSLALQAIEASSLKNIVVYDAWWRLFRNMNITTEEELYFYAKKEWPKVITEMLKHLSAMPYKLLKKGVMSKLMMSYSYIKNRKNL